MPHDQSRFTKILKTLFPAKGGIAVASVAIACILALDVAGVIGLLTHDSFAEAKIVINVSLMASLAAVLYAVFGPRSKAKP